MGLGGGEGFDGGRASGGGGRHRGPAVRRAAQHRRDGRTDGSTHRSGPLNWTRGRGSLERLGLPENGRGKGTQPFTKTTLVKTALVCSRKSALPFKRKKALFIWAGWQESSNMA